MAEPISIQQLKDASLDVKSLEEVVNGDEYVVVTTRLGETYPSVKGSIKKLFENGGLPATPFKTKALMVASSLANGKYAIVTDDVKTDVGLYLKEAGTWKRSVYDPTGIQRPLTAGKDLFALPYGNYYANDSLGLLNFPPAERPYGAVIVSPTISHGKSVIFKPYGRDTAYYEAKTFETGWTAWQKFSPDAALTASITSGIAGTYASNTDLADLVAALSQADYLGKEYTDAEVAGSAEYGGGSIIGVNYKTGAKAAIFNTLDANIYNSAGGDVEFRVYLADTITVSGNTFIVYTAASENYSYSGVITDFPTSKTGSIDLGQVIKIPPNTKFVIAFKEASNANFKIGYSPTMKTGFDNRSFSLGSGGTGWTGAVITTASTDTGEGYGYTQAAFRLRLAVANSNSVEVVKATKPILPPKIYVMQGLESHIYPEHLFFEPNDSYYHKITCSKGKQMERGWLLNDAAAGASSTALSWSIFDKTTASEIDSASTTIVTANASSTGNKKVLVMGDSYVNAGVITQRLLDIAETDPISIELIGTRGTDLNKHEGRGGWKINDYTSSTRVSYQFTVTGVTIPPAINSAYDYKGSAMLIEYVALTAGNGTITASLYEGTAPTGSGNLTRLYSTVGDSSITSSAVTAVAANPFWQDGAVNFAKYLTKYNLSAPDVVAINLGVNDSFIFTDDASVVSKALEHFALLDTLIAKIKVSNAATKFGLIAAPSYANQDAFGKDYGCAYTAWRASRNIKLWNRELYKYYKDKEAQGIYIVAGGLNVDTLNNFPTVSEPINSHNTTLISRQSNSVHPDSSGYKQMGDAVFCWIKSL